MATDATRTTTEPLAPEPATRFDWHYMMRAMAIADLLALLATVLFFRDLLGVALGLIVLAGLALLWLRHERLGALVLVGVLGDNAFYTVTGSVTNLLNGESGGTLVIPAFLAATSTAGLVAALAVLLHRQLPHRGDARPVAYSAAVFFVLLVGGGLLFGGHAKPAARASDIMLVTENVHYSQTELSARPGPITLALENHDLFWHTFTIDALGVDLKVPVSGKQQVTFTAPAGTYSFYCTIPGHELIGMRGTLTVR